MLPVEQVIDLAKMYVMYNYTNGNLPHGAFANTWPTNRERRREGNQTNLRNDEDLYVPLPVRKICMYQCGRSVCAIRANQHYWQVATHGIPQIMEHLPRQQPKIRA